MSISARQYGQFKEYLEYYPREGEPGYDKKHRGVKGISENAPEEAKKAYRDYQKMLKRAEKKGYKL